MHRFVGEADEAGGRGATGDPGGGEIGGFGHHRAPRDANRGQAEPLGNGGVVKADEWRERLTLLATEGDHGFGQAIIAGENAGGILREEGGHMLATSFDEPRAGRE